jgi:DNA modification methylase
VNIRNRIVGHRRVRAGDLVPHELNYRLHPDHQKAALKGIYKEVGFARSLLAYELPDGRLKLIDGHLRRDIDPDMEVDVEILDVTDDEAKKLLLLIDPLASLAEDDSQRIAELLKIVETDDAGISQMLAGLAEDHGIVLGGTPVGLVDPDSVPEPPDEATTKPGDVIILGNHRLGCGNSSIDADVDKLLDGAVIHMVNTDPPYNVRVEPRSNNAIAAGLSSFEATGKKKAATHHQSLDLARHPEKEKPTTKKLRPKDRPLANDFVSDAEFEKLLHAWFGNITRVLLPGRAFYIWGGYANVANYPPVLKAHGLYFSQAIIWVKEHPVLTRKDFMGNHEWCFYGWREGAAHQFYGPTNAVDVWPIKKVNPQSMIHLTEKPVELARRAIEYSSRPGENVLDLFGGSGSTLIGAEQTGRRAFLMELDPLYCDVIVQRWEQFTGKKAERK